MNIRTMGEWLLHDIINEQAKEIIKLKADLSASRNNLSSVRYNFKAYKAANEELNLKGATS